jgi:hypothetical protein
LLIPYSSGLRQLRIERCAGRRQRVRLGVSAVRFCSEVKLP